MAEKILFNEKEKRITIPILIKLFATNMVANSFFGFDNNWLITLDFELFVLFNSSKSVWLSEKSATSDAETMAEQKSKIIIPMMPKSMLVSTCLLYTSRCV